MDITVDRASLLRELQLCAAVVEKRNTIPVLSHVLLDADAGQLSIRATDLTLTLVTNCAAAIREAGGCSTDLTMLIEIVRSVGGDTLTLQSTDRRLHVQCGMSKFDVLSLAPDDFPSMPDADEAAPREVNGSVLTSILHATVYATTDSEAKYRLVGPVLKFAADRVTSYGTDGHRIAIAEAILETHGKDSRGLLPRKAVAAAAKVFGKCETVSLAFGDDNAVLRGDDRVLVVRRQDYTVIDMDAWRKMLRFGDPATVARADLLAAVRRNLITAPERTRALRFDLTRGRVGVSSASAERGAASDTVPGDYGGEDQTIYFDGKYIADAIEGFDTETLCVTPITDPHPGWSFQPVNQPDDGERFAVVMSMDNVGARTS